MAIFRNKEPPLMAIFGESFFSGSNLIYCAEWLILHVMVAYKANDRGMNVQNNYMSQNVSPRHIRCLAFKKLATWLLCQVVKKSQNITQQLPLCELCFSKL